MAVINIQVTAVLNADGRPFTLKYDDGTNMAYVDLTIPQGTTYSTTDRCALIHSGGNDMKQLYGATWIRQVWFDHLFGSSVIASGTLKGIWAANIQKLLLDTVGNTGALRLNDQELANGTALGAAVMTARARVEYNGV